MTNKLFSQVTIIGLGLIGSSLALALKDKGVAEKVVGLSRSVSTQKYALSAKIVDEVYGSVEEAVLGADCIVLCTPLGAMEGLLIQISQSLHKRPNDRCIITDAGSSKMFVVEAARKAFSGVLPPFFVPGHPIAGSEKSGIEAGNVQLFLQHTVILTPLAETDSLALKTVSNMWEAVGALVEIMDVTQHDQYLAVTSHVPHLLSFAYMYAVSMKKDEALYDYAAGGLRDFTRIAASDPTVWRDIFLSNKQAVCEMLTDFEAYYAELKEAILFEKTDTIIKMLGQAKGAREVFSGVLEKRVKNQTYTLRT